MLSAKIGYFRPTGFDPRSISGLGFWYDFSDSSTVTLDGNNLIQQVTDKSGNSRTLTQGTASLRPGIATVSGRNVADWGSAANEKFLSNATSGNYIELSVVVDYDGPNQFGAILAVFGGNGSTAGLLTFTTGTWLSNAQGSSYTNFATNGAESTVALPAVLSASVTQAWRASAQSFDGIRIGTDRGLTGRGWRGKICEIMAWTRALTASERVVVRRWLASKWSVTLPPQVSNADAQNWIDRVYGNGGTVSTSTATAVNDFCNAIDSAGLRDRFYRLNLFAGTGLAAALVPLYRGQSLTGTQVGNATDTNTNFVAGDYVETGTTGGLTGNGSNKRLQTGMDMVAAGISHTDTHCSWYSRAQITANNSPLSTFGGQAAQATFGALTFGGLNLIYYRSGGASNCGIEGAAWSGANRSGHLLCQRTNNDAKVYRNGVDLNLAVSMTNTNNWSVTSPGAPSVFARNRADSGNTGDQFLAATLQGYSIGTSFTASQAAAFSSAVVAFQTALGRN